MAIETPAFFADVDWHAVGGVLVMISAYLFVLLGVRYMSDGFAARRRERVWATYAPQPQRWENSIREAERRVPVLRCKSCDQVVASGALHTCPVTLKTYDTTADDWSSFFLSLGVAYATDSSLLGGLAGGSLAGAVAGDLLRDGQFDLLPGDDTPEPKPEPFQLDAIQDDTPAIEQPEADLGSIDDAGSFDSGYSPD